VSVFVSHLMKHACVCGEGNVPGLVLALHLVSHSFLAWSAADPLENEDVGLKALAMAAAATNARNLAFMGNSPNE
jgi:hypothetical protein